MKSEVLQWLEPQLTEDDLHLLLSMKAKPPVVNPVQPNLPATGKNFTVKGVSLRYSTVSCFNSDMSALVLEHPGGTIGLHKGDGEFYMRLPGVNASSEIVWTDDKNVFNFVDGNAVRLFDISRAWNVDAISTIRQFPEYIAHDGAGRNGVRAMGEGDLQQGRYWALAGTLPSGEIDFFAFDTKSGTPGPRVKLPGVDGLYRTPDGNVLVTYPHSNGKGRFKGVELFDAEMNFLRQIVTAFGHGDVGRDDDGDECWVYSNANDPNPIAPNAVVSVKLADPDDQKLIVSIDWDAALHCSCSEQKGVLLISTFDLNAGTSRKGYVDELILYNRGTVTSLGKHGSDGGTYGGQPQAVLSRDGKACAWNVNDAVNVRFL